MGGTRASSGLVYFVTQHQHPVSTSVARVNVSWHSCKHKYHVGLDRSGLSIKRHGLANRVMPLHDDCCYLGQVLCNFHTAARMVWPRLGVHSAWPAGRGLGLFKLDRSTCSSLLTRHSRPNKLDDLEQYSRRNCLHDYREPPESVVVSRLNTDMPNLHICMKDIDRVHRLGKPQQSPHKSRKQRPRPMIVKFVSYQHRAKAFQEKRLLKGTGMCITESLTPVRNNQCGQTKKSPVSGQRSAYKSVRWRTGETRDTCITQLLEPDQSYHTQSMVAKRGLKNWANIHTPLWTKLVDATEFQSIQQFWLQLDKANNK